MKTLSIIIPAFNEERYIGKLLDKINEISIEDLGFKKEIIIVDDGSNDKTFEIANLYENVKAVKQLSNQGKGRAVRKGISISKGDFILIQDADLEYDPKDYLVMLQKLNDSLSKDVSVYGSRTLGRQKIRRNTIFWGRHPNQGLGPWIAGIILTSLVFVLYGILITDTLTAYKLYPGNLLRSYDLKTMGFETDHEITARLIANNIEILEVPISYNPRSIEEGKKISWKDGFIAVWTLFRFRLIK